MRRLRRWRRNAYKDEWFDEIEKLGRRNIRPFNSWFGNKDRVYFPFNPASGDDNDVIELLDESGFEVYDYRGGYCRLSSEHPRGPSNRPLKIGKVLARLHKNELKRIKKLHEEGKLHNLKREEKKTNQYFQEVMNTFTASPYRASEGISELSVVISQNPHDMAKMSTERSWESCMTLGSGGSYSSCLDEVASGGLVAYLIRTDDPDIENPIARIHIRRFDLMKPIGGSKPLGNLIIAKPEESVYGDNVEGFEEAVNKWIDLQQGEIPMGVYQLKGGSYSDSWGPTTLFGKLPSDPEELIKLYRGEGLEHIPYKTWTVRQRDAASPLIDDEEPVFYDKSDAEERIHLVFDSEWEEEDWREEQDRYAEQPFWTILDKESGDYKHAIFTIKEDIVDERDSIRRKAAQEIINAKRGIFPIEIIKSIKDVHTLPPDIINLLIEKYPELYTGEEIERRGKHGLIKWINALDEQGPTPGSYRAAVGETVDMFTRLVESPASFLLPCPKCGQPINPELEPTFACKVIDRSGWADSIERATFPILHHTECPGVCEQMIKDKELGIINVSHFDYAYSATDSRRAATGRMPMTDIMDLYVEFRRRSSSRNIARPIPEGLIQKLVTMPERTYLIGAASEKLKSRIMHLLSLTGSDTPTVQTFYESLLPNWKYELDPKKAEVMRLPIPGGRGELHIFNLGLAIARLGENGQRFLPFINSRLDRIVKDFGPQVLDPNTEAPTDNEVFDRILNAEGPDGVWADSSYFRNQLWHRILKTTERYLYILDSIESGEGRSSKYEFYGE